MSLGYSKNIQHLQGSKMGDDFSQSLYEIDIYGYTKIDGCLVRNETESLLSIVKENYERINFQSKLRYPGTPERDSNDKIIYNVHNYSKNFIEILSIPIIELIAKKYLNDPYYRYLPEDVPNYILNYYNARSSGGALDLHIDSHVPFPGDKTYMMQFVFLLEDSSEDNGCTVVVPGSHKSGKYSNRSLNQVKPVTGRAGDLIIWDSRLWHGTLRNSSGRSRWALVATLSTWWIKQTMNIAETVSSEVFQSYTIKEKQLLGLCSLPSKDPFSRVNIKCGYEHLIHNGEG
jgi:hypothetical protein